MSANRIILKFSKLDSRDSHTVYKIIVTENNDTWELQARYKRLRGLYKELKVKYGKESLPRFPPKKFFGIMSESFILQRQQALENFFNNVLKNHELDAVGSLKDFLLDGKRSSKKAVGQPEIKTDKGRNTNLTVQTTVNDKKTVPQKGTDVEKVVENIKKQFSDLNDNFEPKDEYDVSKKKNVYSLQFQIKDCNLQYNLPEGTEANLIYVNDPTFTNLHDNVTTLCEAALDNIHKSITDLKLVNTDIVVVP